MFNKNKPDVGYYKYNTWEKIICMQFEVKNSTNSENLQGRLTKLFRNFMIFENIFHILKSQFFQNWLGYLETYQNKIINGD
jgi:hypothetical protein